MNSQQPPSPFRLQLAIQGGGAKIVALLAALEVVQKLEADKKIKVTRIAGTSAGAIVGSLFAAGVPMSLVRQRFRDLTPAQLAAAFPPLGLNVVTQLGRGKPLWKPDFLKNELARFFREGQGCLHFRTTCPAECD